MTPSVSEVARVGPPLRFLFAVDTPWTERLGVPRVSIELSRQLIALGHQVEHFSLDDVRPPITGKLRAHFTTPLFQRALRRHIQKNGSRYDVIQAEHNLLVFRRGSYHFDGVLIAKSNGLRHFYAAFQDGREREVRRLSHERGSLIGNMIRALATRFAGGMTGSADRSFRCADQIHLLNNDELKFVRDRLGHGSKCHLIPNGLTDEFAAELEASADQSARAASSVIAVLGTWCVRKGKLELPEIFRRVRERVSGARLRLIGTHSESQEILSSFASEDQSAIQVIPQFDSALLPGLLRDARVGLFPSYVEGFPLGLLEMHAAKLPVVAWDAPGIRGQCQDSLSRNLVPCGDIVGTVSRLIELLNASRNDYRVASEACCRSANQFRWKRSAQQFLEAIVGHPNSRRTKTNATIH